MLANTPAGKQVKYRRMHEQVRGLSERANGRASGPVLTSGFFVILEHSEIKTDGGISITFWKIHLQLYAIFPVLEIFSYQILKNQETKYISFDSNIQKIHFLKVISISEAALIWRDAK